MTASALSFFGGASIRQMFKAELASFFLGCGRLDGKYLASSRYNPTSEAIRNARSHNKRRERVYNYERDQWANLWRADIYMKHEATMTPLLKFDNGAKVATINTNHRPILTKTLESVLAHQWPEIQIAHDQWGHEPLYLWETKDQDQDTDPTTIKFVSNDRGVYSIAAFEQIVQYEQSQLSPMHQLLSTWEFGDNNDES